VSCHLELQPHSKNAKPSFDLGDICLLSSNLIVVPLFNDFKQKNGFGTYPADKWFELQ